MTGFNPHKNNPLENSRSNKEQWHDSDPFEVGLRDRLIHEKGFKYIGVFDEQGLAIATKGNQNEQKYFINRKGEEISGPFHHAQPFKEDLARIRKDEGYYFIDRQGNQVIGPLDGYIGDFENGLVSVAQGSEKHFLDKNGQRVDKKEKPGYQPRIESVDPIEWPAIEYKLGGKCLVNEQGEIIAGPFNRIDSFSEGLALVNIAKEDDSYGENYYMDKEGKLVLGPYDGYRGYGFSEGTAVVMDKNRNPYRIDHNGKKVF